MPLKLVAYNEGEGRTWGLRSVDDLPGVLSLIIDEDEPIAFFISASIAADATDLEGSIVEEVPTDDERVTVEEVCAACTDREALSCVTPIVWAVLTMYVNEAVPSVELAMLVERLAEFSRKVHRAAWEEGVSRGYIDAGKSYPDI